MSEQRPQADPLDLALIGLSVLALIFSFLKFSTYLGGVRVQPGAGSRRGIPVPYGVLR